MYSVFVKSLAPSAVVAVLAVALNLSPIPHQKAIKQDESIERVVQMTSINNSPVEVTDVRIAESSIKNKKEIMLSRQIGDWVEFKSAANEDWLRNVAFTLKNVSERPIVAITAELQIGHPGIDLAVALPLSPSNRVPAFLDKRNEANPKFKKLMPGQEIHYQLGPSALDAWEAALKRFNTSGAPSVVEINILRVQFDRDTSWSGGEIFRRNPKNTREWVPEHASGKSKRKAALTNAAHAGGSASGATSAAALQTGGCFSSSNDLVFDCFSYTIPCQAIDQHVTSTFGSWRLVDVYVTCYDDGLNACNIYLELGTRRYHNPKCVI